MIVSQRDFYICHIVSEDDYVLFDLIMQCSYNLKVL